MKNTDYRGKYICLKKINKRLYKIIDIFGANQGVVFDKEQNCMYIRKNGSIIYIDCSIVEEDCCSICLEKKKTTSHHVIPRRLRSKNKLLSLVRIRACEECEEKIHPENGFDEIKIIEKQSRKVNRLKKKLECHISDIKAPLVKHLEEKRTKIAIATKKIPDKYVDNKRKIQPKLKYNEGRIHEISKLISAINRWRN